MNSKRQENLEAARERTGERVRKSLARRYAAERRFRFFGIVAITLGMVFLSLLFITIIGKGYSAFQQTYIGLDVHFSEEHVDPEDSRSAQSLAAGDYNAVIKNALREQFSQVSSRRDKRTLYSLVSNGASFDLRDMLLANPEYTGTRQRVWLLADDDVDMIVKGHIQYNDGEQAPAPIMQQKMDWVAQLQANNQLDLHFNVNFFTHGDSREPEQAGIWGAAVGSIYTIIVTLLLSFPIGVAAAVYLEEFAPQNRWTDIIEVNINNLAAVPSIVFGLLGLAVFINFFGMPRSAPLVGGLVLTLMTLPTIIIAGRASLKSVPPSIREAALGIGASRLQTVFYHVLPLAMPGMLTGTIIGMAQALGETAPLLMIGMVAFIVDIPGSVFDPSTALPVQIYLWADSPERAFVERTSAAIMVLLAFLITMNALAVILRKRFERRW
jgi:phosphate transport system permease protein